MGETLEYLESLYNSGDFDELENCGECLADWGISIESDIPISRIPISRRKKGKKVKL